VKMLHDYVRKMAKYSNEELTKAFNERLLFSSRTIAFLTDNRLLFFYDSFYTITRLSFPYAMHLDFFFCNTFSSRNVNSSRRRWNVAESRLIKREVEPHERLSRVQMARRIKLTCHIFFLEPLQGSRVRS